MNLRLLVLTRIIPVFVVSLLSLGIGGIFLLNDAVSQRQAASITDAVQSFGAQLEQFHHRARSAGELIGRSQEFVNYSSARDQRLNVESSANVGSSKTDGSDRDGSRGGSPEKDSAKESSPEESLLSLFYRSLDVFTDFEHIFLLDHQGHTLLSAGSNSQQSELIKPGQKNALPASVRNAIRSSKNTFFTYYAMQDGEPAVFFIFQRTNTQRWEGYPYFFVLSSKINAIKELAGRLRAVDGFDFVMVRPNGLRLMATNQSESFTTWFEQQYLSLERDGEPHSIDFPGGPSIYVATTASGNTLVGFAPRRPPNDGSVQFSTLALIVTVLAVAVCIFLTTYFIDRLVAQPIKQLARDLRSGTEGDNVRLKKNYAAVEINELAETFEKVLAAEHEARSQIQNMAYFDSLTGLANRRLFATYLARIVSSAQRSNESLAVMFIDLDNFKFINDSYGHHFGDRVLIEFAERIKNTVRTSDLVSFLGEGDAAQSIARLAGDEFAVLLTSLEDNFSAAVVAERLLENTREPIEFEGQVVHIEASIGIAVFPDDAGGPQQLIQHADAAMYHAKMSGKNTYCFFSQHISNTLARQRDIQQALRHALLEDEFDMLFQPYVNRIEHRICGAEILLRWNSKILGAVAPEEFIPVAESTGLIKEIDAWLLSKALELLDTWQQREYPDINLSINISAAEMRNLSFPGFVAASLKGYAIEPHRVEFEITETKLVNYDERSMDIFTRLKDTGVTLILDDFGKGFTSLNQLKELPVHRLKIDRDYVAEIAAKSGHLQIVDVILLLSHSYQLNATAEGVEFFHQVEYLEEAGCDYLQGFYFSEPIKLEQLTVLLESNNLVLTGNKQERSANTISSSWPG